MRSDVKDIEHVQIRSSSMDSDDGKALIGELNQILTDITGDDGTAHFHKEDVETIIEPPELRSRRQLYRHRMRFPFQN